MSGGGTDSLTMTNGLSNRYDEVEYPSTPLPQAHPDRLATLASLFGLSPAPVESCRVLELGCGDGANLIAMAFGLPGGRFEGLDLSNRAVSRGAATVRQLGLKNIVLTEQDICQVQAGYGPFDYIVAHGLYSWVPPAVRDRLLEICKQSLASNGIAYVSYNAYPGGHLRNVLREMMLFHVRGIAEPESQVNAARHFVSFLANSSPKKEFYKSFLQEQLERVTDSSDGGLYHDDLAAINTSVYFRDFIEHAKRNGLQYLGEAALSDMLDQRFPPHVREELNALAGDDVVIKEQYMDFLKARMFRQTLLCHEGVAIDRKIKPEQMRSCYVASPVRPVSEEPDLRSRKPEEFRSPKGASMTSDHPFAKAAICQLSEIWPGSLPFDELLIATRTKLGISGADGDEQLNQDAAALGEIVLATYLAGLVELHVHQPRLVARVSQRPTASPLARLQVQDDLLNLSTLLHSTVKVDDPLGRRLLLLLDGTRDRYALREELVGLIQSGGATIEIEGHTVSDPEKIRELISQRLEQKLGELARLGLLIT
jgi:methyltransferase-like protein/predicted O-methyltransferase YrrM